MTDMLDRLERAREHVRLPEAEDPKAVDRQWRRLKARQRRQRTAQIVAAAAVVLIAVGSIPFLLQGPEPVDATATHVPDQVVEPAEDGADLRFNEGSTVAFLEEGTEVVTEEVSAEAIRLALASGAARFQVTSGLERAFVVAVDDATVTVVGTRFVVGRTGEHTFRVEVDEGRVAVRSPGEDGAARETILGPGDSFETRSIAPATGAAEAPREAEPAAASEARRAPQRRRPEYTWRVLAEDGRFDEAYDALLREDDVREQDVGDLMLAADAARLSGHRDEAVAFLREVLEHPEDPRASLGAFTLGRVLLRVRPPEAAEAFGTARRLDPDSSLAPDALAREVEAWYLAGRPERAYELAQEYVRRWPDGRRIEAVRRFGGLD